MWSMLVEDVDEIIYDALDIEDIDSISIEYYKNQAILEPKNTFEHYRDMIMKEISSSQEFEILAMLNYKNEKRSTEKKKTQNLPNLQDKNTEEDNSEPLMRLIRLQISQGMPLNAIKNLKKLRNSRKNLNLETSGDTEIMLGFLKTSLGRLDESLQYYQQGLEAYYTQFGIKAEQTGFATSNLGSIFSDIGDIEQSIEFQNSAKTILSSIHPEHPSLAYVYYNLGIAQLSQN